MASTTFSHVRRKQRLTTVFGLLVVGVAVASFVTWRILDDTVDACDVVSAREVSAILDTSVSREHTLTNVVPTAATGCGFSTKASTDPDVLVWIENDGELHSLLDAYRSRGVPAASGPEAWVVPTLNDSDSAAAVTKNGRVISVTVPGHSGAALRLAQWIAKRVDA